MYIMFPIGWMYYFGTNLENRFTVPDFWPNQEQSHKIPFEKEDIRSELERMRARNDDTVRRRLREAAAGSSSSSGGEGPPRRGDELAATATIPVSVAGR